MVSQIGGNLLAEQQVVALPGEVSDDTFNYELDPVDRDNVVFLGSAATFGAATSVPEATFINRYRESTPVAVPDPILSEALRMAS